jgi:hypothetical protein
VLRREFSSFMSFAGEVTVDADWEGCSACSCFCERYCCLCCFRGVFGLFMLSASEVAISRNEKVFFFFFLQVRLEAHNRSLAFGDLSIFLWPVGNAILCGGAVIPARR